MSTREENNVSICIVNWNAGSQLRDCISSIACAAQDGFVLSSVVIVDNGSTDDSLDGVDRMGVPVTVIRNGANRGFAAACNQAAAVASGDSLLFLNPDTRLFENAIREPVLFMMRPENASVGICGIQLVDESFRNCLSYASFPTLSGFVLQTLGIKRLLADTGREVTRGVCAFREVDQVIGAFFLTRRKVFEDLHGFDERFFVYFEEVDFASRARNAGWISVCLTGIHCMHAGGGTSRQVKAARLFYSLRSRLLYGFKHFSLPAAGALTLITLVPEFISRLALSIMRGGWQDIGYTVQGYAMLIREMPATLRVAADMRKQRG